MPVCEYFLKGRCLFGENCFNEHPRGPASGDRGGAGRHISFRDNSGAGYSQGHNPYKWTSNSSHQGSSPQNTASTEDLLKSFQKDVETWQTSKMWPFSCVTFEPNLPSIPDIPDISPEELRQEAYTAIQQNTLDQFKLKVSHLIEQYRQWQDQLKSADPAVRHRLVEFIEESRRKKSTGSLIKPSLFGGQTGSSTFGAGASHSSIFGGAAAGGLSSPATFGQTGSFSGLGLLSSSPATVFGGSQPSVGCTSLLGQQQFGQAASGPSVGFFRTSNGGLPSGQSTVGGGNSLGASFGQGSPFGQVSPRGGLFGQLPVSTTSPAPGFGAHIVGSAAAGGLFGAPPNQSPTLQGSVFGGSSQAKGAIFGQAGAFQNGSSTGTGIFTSSPSSVNAAAGATLPGHGSLYTAVNELTADEKEQFLAKTFTAGKIPLRPPPEEMINI